MNISIVIPIKSNKAITRMIESIRKQTFSDFEVIGVYDVEVCEAFEMICMMDYRFKSFMGNGRGAGAARNIGLNHSRGKYIIFLDSDDFFHEKMLQRAFDAMEEYDLDACIWNVSEYDDISKQYIEDTTHFRPELCPKEEVFSGNNTEYIFNLTSGAPWNKMFNRQFVLDNNIRFMEQPRFNDLFFSFVNLAKANRICVINEIGTYYRINHHNSLQFTKEQSIEDAFAAFDSIFNYFEHEGMWGGGIKRSFQNYVLSCTMALSSATNDYSIFYKIVSYIKETAILSDMSHTDSYHFHKELYDNFVLLKEKDLGEYIYRQKLVINEICIMQSTDYCDSFPEDYMKYKYSDYRLTEIEKSFSYKLSMKITWLPRLIRSLGKKRN